MTDIRLVRRLFRLSPIYGVLVLLPNYFVELAFPAFGQPAETHPEYLYGFVGAALVSQWLYWIIGGDPVRFRPLMPVAILAKLAFFVPVAILVAIGRTQPVVLAFASVDGILAVLFYLAWRRTPTA